MVAKSIAHICLTLSFLFLIEDFDHYRSHLVDDALWVNAPGGFKEDFSKYLVGQSIASLIFVKKDLYVPLPNLICHWQVIRCDVDTLQTLQVVREWLMLCRSWQLELSLAWRSEKPAEQRDSRRRLQIHKQPSLFIGSGPKFQRGALLKGYQHQCCVSILLTL